jgi:hypothetical protein
MNQSSSVREDPQSVPQVLTSDTDVYFGRGEDILRERARIKRQTLTDRRLRHHAQAA